MTETTEGEAVLKNTDEPVATETTITPEVQQKAKGIVGDPEVAEEVTTQQPYTIS